MSLPVFQFLTHRSRPRMGVPSHVGLTGIASKNVEVFLEEDHEQRCTPIGDVKHKQLSEPAVYFMLHDSTPNRTSTTRSCPLYL